MYLRRAPGKSEFAMPLLLAAKLACSSAQAAGSNVQEEAFSFGAFRITRLTLREIDSPPVQYYLSTPSQRAPLVLYIQGSGCVPPFVGLGTSTRYSTIYSWLPLASQQRYAVMAVDKPYQSDERQKGAALFGRRLRP